MQSRPDLTQPVGTLIGSAAALAFASELAAGEAGFTDAASGSAPAGAAGAAASAPPQAARDRAKKQNGRFMGRVSNTKIDLRSPARRAGESLDRTLASRRRV